MSVIVSTSVFQHNGTVLTVLEAEAHSMVGVADIVAPLWLVRTATDAYYGVDKNQMIQLSIPSPPGDTGGDIEVGAPFLVRMKDTSDTPYITIFMPVAVRGAGYGYHAQSAPILAVFNILTKQELNYDWGNTKSHSSFITFSRLATELGYDPLVFPIPASAPHWQLSHMGYAGPSNPESIFVFGIEAGAFVVNKPYQLAEEVSCSVAKIPACSGFSDTVSPWVVESPTVALGNSGYGPPGLEQVSIMGIYGCSNARYAAPAIMGLSFTRDNNYSGGFVLATISMELAPRDEGDFYRAVIKNLDPTIPIITLTSGTGTAMYFAPMSCYEKLSLSGLCMGWDIGQVAEPFTNPSAVVSGDGIIYGGPGFIGWNPKNLVVLNGDTSQSITCPSDKTPVHSLACGHQGSVYDPGTTGIYSMHLANAGFVVAAKNCLYYADNPATLDWNSPALTLDSYTSNAAAGARVSFCDQFLRKANRPYPWIAVNHYVRGDTGHFWVYIHGSNSGDSWDLLGSWDITDNVHTLLNASSGGDDWAITSIWGTVVHITPTMTLVRVEAYVLRGSGATKTVAFTIINCQLSAPSTFQTSFDDFVTSAQTGRAQAMRGDACNDILVTDSSANVIRYYAATGTSSIIKAGPSTFSDEERARSAFYMTKTGAFPNLEALYAFYDSSGSEQLMGVSNPTNSIIAQSVTLGVQKLYPLKQLVTRWFHPAIGLPQSYPGFNVFFSTTTPALGTVLFFGDAFSSYPTRSFYGREKGATHVMFSDTQIQNEFWVDGVQLLADEDRKPFTLLRLPFVVHDIFEVRDSEATTDSPKIYLTDHTGRVLLLSRKADGIAVSSNVEGYATNEVVYLITFEDVGGAPSAEPLVDLCLVTEPVIVDDALNTAAVFSNGSDSTDWNVSAIDPLQSAWSNKFLPDARCLYLPLSDGECIFDRTGNGRQIDFCATVINGDIYQGYWGCLLHVATKNRDNGGDGYGFINVLLSVYGVKLQVGNAASGAGNFIDIDLPISLVDGLPHHYRLIFVGDWFYLIIDGGGPGKMISHNCNTESWITLMNTGYYVSSMSFLGHPSSTWYIRGTVEWIKVSSFSTPTQDLTGKPSLSPVFKYKPTALGTPMDASKTSLDVFSTSLADGTHHGLKIAKTGSFWVAAWGEGYAGSPSGPMHLATSPDMVTWTPIELEPPIALYAADLKVVKAVFPKLQWPGIPTDGEGVFGNIGSSF